MNEKDNKLDERHETAGIADLEALDAEDIKGGTLNAGRVRVSNSSGFSATARENNKDEIAR